MSSAIVKAFFKMTKKLWKLPDQSLSTQNLGHELSVFKLILRFQCLSLIRMKLNEKWMLWFELFNKIFIKSEPLKG